MESIPQILKSRDYSIFKHVAFNRQKSKHHISQLKELILKENLLHLHPILVNEDMEVVDGQHRLEVAKELGIDIYYIKDKISYEHILNSNLFQKKLSLEDVIKFYATKDKIPSYVFINQYITDLKISPKALIGLIFGTCSVPLIEMVKSGKFDLPSNRIDLDKLLVNFKEFKTFVEERKLKPISMFNSSFFTIAFRNLVLLSEFSKEVWRSKLELRWFDLKPQINAMEWTKQIVGIYNWKNQNPISYGTH